MAENKQIEEVLVQVAESFANTALTVREVKPVLIPTFVTINKEMLVTMFVIHDIDHRIRVIRECLELKKGLGFALVYDGYITKASMDESCPTCGGKGCLTCRDTGKKMFPRQEAIHGIIRTRWGFNWGKAWPYEFQGGKLDPKPPVLMTGGVSMDGYDAVFPETRPVEH